MLKFGFSSREYILLHENSKEDDDELDPLSFSDTELEVGGGAKREVGAKGESGSGESDSDSSSDEGKKRKKKKNKKKSHKSHKT